MEGFLICFLLPFIGTLTGSSCVFLLKKGLKGKLEKAMLGFAAGVMVAASVWSLLIPSMEMIGGTGITRVYPVVIGFLIGVFFLLGLDILVPHQHPQEEKSEGVRSGISKTTKLVLAITLHNIPEGMAVGVVLAGALQVSSIIPMAAAIALAVGMSIQNVPEGLIVSMPIRSAGNSKLKSFLLGALSGCVEPVSVGLTLLLTESILPLLPYILAFSAGAMMYVVVEELIPETQKGEHSNLGTIGFSFGFSMMMLLDIVLG